MSLVIPALETFGILFSYTKETERAAELLATADELRQASHYRVETSKPELTAIRTCDQFASAGRKLHSWRNVAESLLEAQPSGVVKV